MLRLEQLPRFPCRRSNKKPLTRHGFYDAAVNVDDRGWPLVGVPSGTASGIDWIDIDPRHGGDRWLDLNFDAIPRTRVHSTRGGGIHIALRHAGGRRFRDEIAPGVEVKSDGRYVIWWPREGLPFEDWPICEWPDWLLEEALHPVQCAHGSASPRTANPEARARSLFEVVLRDRTEKSLHWAACRFAEMIIEGFPRKRAIKILQLAASASRITGAEETIANGLAIIDRRIEGLIRTLATAQEEHRNKTLYWVAIELVRLTPRAEDLLIEAAHQCGLVADDGLQSVQATISSALTRGGGTMRGVKSEASK